MPLVVQYPCHPATGAVQSLSVAAIRAVAAQVRQQVLPVRGALAIAMPDLIAAAVEMSVNGRQFEFGVTDRFIAVRIARYGLIQEHV